jgi:hypothetical protein
MNRRSDWGIQLAWFAAGICATGAVWYFLSTGNISAAITSTVAATAFVALALYLQDQRHRSSPMALHADRLGAFLAEAQRLRARLEETPLPISDHNDWVNRVTAYLRENLGEACAVRFSDFSGMQFYGDGAPER